MKRILGRAHIAAGHVVALALSEAASGSRIVQMPLPATPIASTTARAKAHAAPPVADMVTLLVRGGRKDKLRPGDSVSAGRAPLGRR